MTQVEIAKKLGVSQAAVSYVLKGGGKVSESLKEKVMELARGSARSRHAEIGIFYSGPIRRGTANAGRFIDLLGRFLQAEMIAAGRDFRHYVDIRIDSLLDKPPKALVEDIDAGKISSIVAANLHWKKACWSWLGKLGVPVVAHDYDFGWGALSYDFENAGFEAAEELAGRGRKRIELLSSVSCEWIDSEVTNKISRPLRAGMANALRARGIKAPECWLTPEKLPESMRDPLRPPSAETMGRELFKLLWKERKPDGVALYTDVFALGVQEAMDELGLKEGRDMDVVLLSNKELGFPGNERFVNLKLSIRKMAKAFLELADAAERGEKPKEIYLKFEKDAENGGKEGAL